MVEDDSVAEVGTGDDLTVEVTPLAIVAEAAGVTAHVKGDIMIEATEEEIGVTVAADPEVIVEVAVEGTEGVEIVVETQRGIETGGGEVAEAGAQVAEVIGDPPLAIVPVGV